jgi:hypothetical protein
LNTNIPLAFGGFGGLTTGGEYKEWPKQGSGQFGEGSVFGGVAGLISAEGTMSGGAPRINNISPPVGVVSEEEDYILAASGIGNGNSNGLTKEAEIMFSMAGTVNGPGNLYPAVMIKDRMP